jgi:hypothetical protein
MLGSSREEKTPRRATRQRARRSSTNVKERASRGRISQKPVPASSERIVSEIKKKPESLNEQNKQEVEAGRKAPTNFSGKKASQAKIRKRNIVIAVVMITGVGSSAAVGMTDSGQINVNQTIEARNERIRTNSASVDDTTTSSIEIPVQSTSNNLANGGLVGSGQPTPKPPVAEPAETSSTTASSSESVATSTDEMSENEEDESVREQTSAEEPAGETASSS